MATTVKIHIIGVAIVYQKGADWHIIFPVDRAGCHTVKFERPRPGAPGQTDEDPLAGSELIKITINPTNGATSTTGADNGFRSGVYNLTSTEDPTTHPKIKERGDSKGKYVLMNLPNAVFSVRKAITFQSPDLVEILDGAVVRSKPITKRIAHSATATIILNDNAQVIVENEKIPGGRFVTEKGINSELTFNNDCDDPTNTENDMELYYKVIEEVNEMGSRVGRKFIIGGGRIPLTKLSKEDLESLEAFAPRKDPPNRQSFLAGNTCLVSQVTDTDSITKLP